MKIFVGGLTILLMLVASTLGDADPWLQQGAAQPHQEDAHPLQATTQVDGRCYILSYACRGSSFSSRSYEDCCFYEHGWSYSDDFGSQCRPCTWPPIIPKPQQSICRHHTIRPVSNKINDADASCPIHFNIEGRCYVKSYACRGSSYTAHAYEACCRNNNGLSYSEGYLGQCRPCFWPPPHQEYDGRCYYKSYACRGSSFSVDDFDHCCRVIRGYSYSDNFVARCRPCLWPH